MIRFFITTCFFVSGLTVLGQSVSHSGKKRVLVTYTVNDEKKPSPRLQVLQKEGGFDIDAFYLPHLPGNFRSIRSMHPKEKAGRGEIVSLAEASFDNAYKKASDSSATRKPASSLFARQKELFLKGKNAPPYFRHQWITLARWKGTPAKEFGFRVKRFFQKPFTYKTDYLPSSFAYRFPTVDPWRCGDITLRMFGLRKLQGYGLGKMRSTRYQVSERDMRRRNFEIYFRRNETTPDQSGVDEIIRYLKSNEYVIVKAEMLGGASVEGDAERNKQLQRKRAEVIRELFREYNDDPVSEDTLLLLDNFAPFREQLRQSQYQWLDTLVNASLQRRINEDAMLMKNLEPYLKSQRKATLRLIMTKKNTVEEQLLQAEDAIARIMRTLAQRNFPEGDMHYRLMGAVDYLMDLYKREQVNDVRLHELIAKSPHADFLYVLIGYHFLKQFETFELHKQSALWPSFWEKLHVKQWIEKAEQSAITLADGAADRGARLKYVSMCVDFQAYAYRFIEKGLIDGSALCEVPYTASPIFTGLRFNQLAFLYELSKQVAVRCFPVSKRMAMRDTTMTADKELEKIKTEREVLPSFTRGEQLPLTPSFDTAPKSAYYELLKSYYVKGDKQVTEWVHYADGGKPELNVFNLYHLTSLSVNAFDPFQNAYYDAEVPLLQMDKLITQLKRIDSYMCLPEVNGLYLDYHLKALYYLQNYAQPGDERMTRVAENSLSFITDYYKKRAGVVSPSVVKHVVEQLNDFNSLPGTQPGAWYGFEILNAVAARQMLQGDLLKLYAHYIKMYNPELKPALPKGYDVQAILQLSKEPFE